MGDTPEVLDPNGDVIGRRPLSPAEVLELLETLSLDEPNLAALLDHVTAQLDHVIAFVDSLAPLLVGMEDLSDSLASGGPMALLGLLSGKH